jgi:uridine kinase
MLILVSGLPRAGKSSFAHAAESLQDGYTHVPLDKYILDVPEGLSFLAWVASPQCVDWPLLQTHLQCLADSQPCFTPAPDWNNRGKRKSAGGSETGGRLMKPAARGYLLPGCYAFHFPMSHDSIYRVFISTPRSVLAERLTGRPVEEAEAASILNQHLSPNWEKIEAYSQEADLVISGIEAPQAQVQVLLDALRRLDQGRRAKAGFVLRSADHRRW